MLLTFQIPGASSRSAHHRPTGAAFAFSAKAVTPALYVAYPESPNPVVFLFNPLLVKCADGPCRGVFPQRVNCALQCRKTVGVVGGQYRIKLLTFQIPGATVELALNVRRRAPCLVIKGFQTLRFLDSPLLVKIADNTAICVPLYL
jgi:hypothetical protein